MDENTAYEPKGEWETVPCSGETDNNLIMVTLRTDINKFRDNPRFNIRVTVSWKYAENGMPGSADGESMQQVTEALTKTFDKDPVAVLTGIYTGEGLREWVFYTLSLNIFGRKLNEALADMPLLPLNISAANDPKWDEYAEAHSALPS